MAQAKKPTNPMESTPVNSTPKRSCLKTGLMVLGGLAAFAIIVIIIAVIATNPIRKVAENELGALKAGDINAAYNLTSNQFKQQTSLAQFQAFVDQYPSLKSNKSASFTESSIENNVGTLNGKLTAYDGTVTPITFKLVKENSEWKILGIELSPSGGATASPTQAQTPTSQPSTQTQANVNKINAIMVSDLLDSRGVVVDNKAVISASAKEINATVYVNVTQPAQLGAALVKVDTNEVISTVKRDMTTTGDRIFNFIFPNKNATWTPGQYLIYSETSTGDNSQIVFTIQ